MQLTLARILLDVFAFRRKNIHRNKCYRHDAINPGTGFVGYFRFKKEIIFVVINVIDMMQLNLAQILLDIFAFRRKNIHHNKCYRHDVN